MAKLISTDPITEKAILIGIINHEQGENDVRDYLNELAFLTETAGAIPVKTFIQHIESANPRTFVGSGNFPILKYLLKKMTLIWLFSMTIFHLPSYVILAAYWTVKYLTVPT